MSAALWITDTLLVVIAWVTALALRYDAEVPADAWWGLAGFLPIVIPVTIAIHAAAGLYSGVLRFASVLEARQILVAQGTILLLLFPFVLFVGRPVPLSVPIIATILCCGMAGVFRFWSRLLRWRQFANPATQGERLVVIGAGNAGVSLVRDIQRHRSERVVAFVDDQAALQGMRILGVRVAGTTADLEGVVEATAATRAVLAITHAPPSLVREVVNTCGDLGVALSIVPPASELLGRQVSLQDVRDIDIADLLGRAQVDTDLDAVSDLIRGQRVLITGGGGSIGSELARQIATFAPASLVLVDHDETHLFDAVALLPHATQRLVDIREQHSLTQVFAEERPELVFHAAALKHVPLLETHVVEAAHTNVLGTRNVVRAAQTVGARRLVFISTDKAVRPSSVMGTTKLVCEHLVLGHDSELKTCAVRFGNVLGSRGSVVPTFVRQIRAGGPVTITDARMTRYFMSIPEAVRLVLHAAALSSGGEIFMLDMGQPVRIIDLAKRMIQLSGQRPGADVEIRVTQIRPGEKLAEQLHAPEELQHPTSHPAVVRLEPVGLPRDPFRGAIEAVEEATLRTDEARVREALSHILTLRQSVVDERREPELSEPHLNSQRGENAWT